MNMIPQMTYDEYHGLKEAERIQYEASTEAKYMELVDLVKTLLQDHINEGRVAHAMAGQQMLYDIIGDPTAEHSLDDLPF